MNILNGFDRNGASSFLAGRFFKNKLIFGVDMSLSVNFDNNKKIYFNSWWRFYTRIRWYYIDSRKKFSVHFTESREKFCLSLNYNGANSYLFVNGAEIHKFKAKNSETVANPLCLGNISRDFFVDNMKKTRLNEFVYDFSVDYDEFVYDFSVDYDKFVYNFSVDYDEFVYDFSVDYDAIAVDDILEIHKYLMKKHDIK